MRGVITLVFDDGYEAVYQHVVPLLNKLDIPAVFALPLDTQAFQETVTEPVRPWSKWLTVRQQGHEIAAHSVTHSDLRQLETQALHNELESSQQSLEATTFVYPGGAYNETVISAVKEYFTAARTTAFGLETLPPADPWRLKTVDYTRDNFSVFKANIRALSKTLFRKSWLIETYHLVDKAPSSMHHSVLLADFERHLHFLKKLPVEIKTIHEVIRDSHN